MAYVDGFVLVIQKDKVDAYRQMASMGARVWMKHGALDYKECIGDDLEPAMPEGVDMPEEMKGMKMMTFPKLLNLKEGEVAGFSYIVYKDRAHRDEVNAKVMKDPEMDPSAHGSKEMPFDMQRMCFGGFEVLVDGK